MASHHHSIEIEIRWKCSHCGQTHEQAVSAGVVGGQNGGGQTGPGTIGTGAMICQNCGQMGPMQFGCAVILGMSVMAGSDGAIHVPRLPEKRVRQFARRIMQPSLN